MKGNLIGSALLHCAVLAWAMLTISAPASFEVADVEALPVDIIPIESITQTMQGAEDAEVKEIAAPVPTTRPDKVENAENAGDNTVDLKSTPKPITKPTNVETAAAPEKVEKVLPQQDDVTNDIKDVAKEQDAAPAPQEVAKLEPVKPEPKPEVKPEPKPEPSPEKAAEEPLPTNIPVPEFKPKQAESKPQEKPVEKTPEKKAEEKPVEKKTEPLKTASTSKNDGKTKGDQKKQETAKSKSSKESDFNADEIASLLNKTDATSGGAKRSSAPAAKGTKKSNGGSKLSQSEMDALRGQIEKNWSVIAGIDGAAGVVIKVTMKLDEEGEIIGEPDVVAMGGSDAARRTLEGSALRAVRRSAPFKGLPRDKYDAWSEVVVNFDPSELL